MSQRPSPSLYNYFGIRNRIRLNPQEGVNYSPAALNLMASRKEADQIASYLTRLSEEAFNISVYPSGIGGVIFALAESPKILTIYTYDDNLIFRQMLQKNLQQYRLQSKVQITPNYQSTDSTILYLDLIKNPQLNPNEFLAELAYPFYAFRTSQKFNLPTPKGYDCQQIKLANQTSLWICQLLVTEAEFDVDPEYLDGLINFLDQLLANIIPGTDRAAYFSDEVLFYWVEAFTHKSIDLVNNYDVLEMLGDRFTKAAFADYITQRIPEIREAGLSVLQNYYLSTQQQFTLARKLGLGEWIRRAGSLTDKMLEDVLESFVGALFKVSEEVQGGLGYYNVFQMVSYLYSQEPLEQQLQNLKSGDDKTAVQQKLAKLQLKVIENFFEDNGMIKFIVSLSQPTREFFEARGIILPKDIGVGTGKTKKTASKQAYANARKFLEQHGVTDKWIEQQQQILTFSRPEFQPYLPDARKRLTQEGFVEMSFSYPSATAGKCLIQLIGHRPSGQKEILATSETCNDLQGKINVLAAYASGK